MVTSKKGRTIRIKVYKFDQLDERAKQIAIDGMRDINVDYDWWDSVYEDFSMLCEKIGLTVDQKKTYFSSFSSQGNGAGFTADVDLLKLIAGISGETWREHAPQLDKDNNFTPNKCKVNNRVLSLIKSGVIEFSVDCEGKDRGYPHTKANISYDYTSGNCVNYKNIDKELSYLEDWVESVVGELDSLFFKLLEGQYDYLTGDEAIKETIEANEYEFLKDGTKY